METTKISHVLDKNEKYLKDNLGQSFDINFRRFIIPAFKDSEALIVNANGMADRKEVDSYLMKPLMELTTLPKNKFFGSTITTILESGIFSSVAKETSSWDELCNAIVTGDTVLFVDNCKTAIIMSTKNLPLRSIVEPSTESETRGPRDGFIENLQVNISLIRRRIKDFGLRTELINIGVRTKTDICLVYISSLVNDSILAELKSRLSKINIDGILASANIEEYIEDAPNSLFPQIEHTERPDKASSAILEGRIIILVDNTPFSLIVPSVFWSFLQASGDYYDRRYIATFLRWVRYVALFLSVTLSSFYVLLCSFHQEMLPATLALKVIEGRAGVPFPSIVEALFMELIMEVLKEAGLRIPRPLGPTVGIVGSIIIGQAAVSAGLVGPILIIVVAISAISSYAIPSQSMSNSIRLVRFPLLLITATFGIFGFLGGIIAILLYLMSMRSFGQPFMAPVIPYDSDAGKNVFRRSPRWGTFQRPKWSRSKDKINQDVNTTKPKPPNK